MLFPAPKEVDTSEEPTTDVTVTQEGTKSVVETPEKATQNKDQTSEKNQSPSSDISVDVSGHEKSGLEGTSPNVSGSSDMVSGTPPKTNSRRQSFITLEKYVEGQSPSPARVAFTGPHTRKSSRLSSLKALEASQSDSQIQTTKEDTEESRKRSSTEPSSQNESAKDKMSTEGRRSEVTDEEEDDVVPDTQTQLSGEPSGVKTSPVSKASVEEQDSPEKDSQSLADSQASQEPRRSGRRRSRPVRPGEDPGEPKSKEPVADSAVTNTQKPTLSPPSSTLTGRRRSRAIEDSKVEGDQLNNKVIKGDLSQNNSQISSAESSQALPQAVIMLGNKEASQTGSPSKSSPVTQSGSPSKDRLPALSESGSLSPGRPTRKTRAHLEESTDKEAHENSQNDPQNAASSLRKKLSQTPVSNSEADSQQRTRRTRRSESQLLEMSSSQTKDESQADSQTLTTVKGRAMRRRTAEEETDSTRDATSTVIVEELSASQDSSEGHGRYRTRRSKGLLAPTENTESENSDSRDDGPRPKKRPRKPLSTEVLPVAAEPKVEMVPDKEEVDVSMEMSQDEAESETSLNILVIETKELEDKEEVLAPDSVQHEQITSDKGADDIKIETKLKTETDTDEKGSISEKSEGEELNLSSQIGLEDLNEKPDISRKCPHTRRGRGRRRSRSCNCFSNNRDVFSQDSDFQESQDLKNEEVPLVTDALNSQPELSTSVSEESKSSAIADVSDADVQPFSALPEQLPSEALPSESPIAKLGVIVSQLTEKEEEAQLELSKLTDEAKEHLEIPVAETDELESSGCTGSQKHKEDDGLENTSVSAEPLQSSTPQDTSPSQGRPVEDAPICQEQLESSHVQQEDAINPAVKESEDLAVSEPSGENIMLPEESNNKELLDEDVDLVEKDEDTQLDNRDPPEDAQEEPPQSSTSGACLDSPPKPKPLDALSGELEPGQSPSRTRSRAWSPSASPSTSILKKGQKRTCEEDTPSPLHKVFDNTLQYLGNWTSPSCRSKSGRSLNLCSEND